MSNQTDQAFSSGNKTKGIVINIGLDQPSDKQNGRIQVRLLEQIDTAIPDEKCPWVPVRQPASSASLRGVGSFPGHSLLVGSLVHCEFDNSGGHYEVTGTILNADNQNKQTQDMHPTATSTSFIEVVNSLIGVDSKNGVLKQIFNNKNPYEYKGTKEALQFLNGKINTNYEGYKKDPVSSLVKHIKTPEKLGGGKGFKSVTDPNTPYTIGAKALKDGDVKDPIKYIEKMFGSKGELIKNEFAMLKSIQSSVKSGGIVDSTSMVGGLNNLAQGLLSSLQIANRAQVGKTKEQKEEELAELEALLRQLYKQITGQEALDENGKETNKYIIWKKENIQLISGAIS